MRRRNRKRKTLTGKQQSVLKTQTWRTKSLRRRRRLHYQRYLFNLFANRRRRRRRQERAAESSKSFKARRQTNQRTNRHRHDQVRAQISIFNEVSLERTRRTSSVAKCRTLQTIACLCNFTGTTEEPRNNTCKYKRQRLASINQLININ